MRIWHKKLIPHLCRNHILAVWREGLGAYSIIVNGKKAYRNHPATQEFIDCPEALYLRLQAIRNEMLSRGYNPKELPPEVKFGGEVKEWQTLSEQIEVLSAKGCDCKINNLK